MLIKSVINKISQGRYAQSNSAFRDWYCCVSICNHPESISCHMTVECYSLETYAVVPRFYNLLETPVHPWCGLVWHYQVLVPVTTNME